MYPKQAVFFALDAIVEVSFTEHGYEWTFDPQLPGLLNDYRALGYRVIGLCDPNAFGMSLETAEECEELVTYVNTLLQESGGKGFDAIHVSTDVSDPRPVWDLRRRLGFSLGKSLMVASKNEHEDLARNAGIGRVALATTLLG